MAAQEFWLVSGTVLYQCLVHSLAMKNPIFIGRPTRHTSYAEDQDFVIS